MKYKQAFESRNDGHDDEDDQEQGHEDNSDIDAFLAEHGFEYVDASRESSSRRHGMKANIPDGHVGYDEGSSPTEHNDGEDGELIDL